MPPRMRRGFSGRPEPALANLQKELRIARGQTCNQLVMDAIDSQTAVRLPRRLKMVSTVYPLQIPEVA